MKKIVLLCVSLLFAVVIVGQRVGRFTSESMLKPDGEIGGMTLSTGAQGSPPLWVFCPAALDEETTTTVDCEIPLIPELAIGHIPSTSSPGLQAMDWSALSWELSVDGQPVDLELFGIYEYAQPDLAPSPSPIREIFRHVRAWDVILIHPTPGRHTLFGRAHNEANNYTWTVNFTVAASDAH